MAHKRVILTAVDNSVMLLHYCIALLLILGIWVVSNLLLL